MSGRSQEAMAEATREPDEAFRLWAMAILHHGTSHGAESDEALRELVEKHAEASAFQIAEAHGARGEVAALEWLERAYAERDPTLPLVKTFPAMDPYRSDPRYVALLQKLRMPLP